MSALAAALLAVTMKLPVAWFPDDRRPETREQRRTRVARVTTEVAEQAHTLEERTGWSALRLASLGMIQAYNESALAYEVHAGVDWPGRPPPFGDRGRAKCLFQLQRSAASVPFDEWRPFEPDQHDQLVGLGPEPTALCVRAGMRALAWQLVRCDNIREAYRKADHRWAATLAYSQVHRPSSSCKGALSPGSTRRAYAYEAFVSRVQQEIERL